MSTSKGPQDGCYKLSGSSTPTNGSGNRSESAHGNPGHKDSHFKQNARKVKKTRRGGRGRGKSKHGFDKVSIENSSFHDSTLNISACSHSAHRPQAQHRDSAYSSDPASSYEVDHLPPVPQHHNSSLPPRPEFPQGSIRVSADPRHHNFSSPPEPASSHGKQYLRENYAPGTIIIAQHVTPGTAFNHANPDRFCASTPIGTTVYCKRRRFVVVYQEEGHTCQLLPIYTHNGKGLKGIKDHAMRGWSPSSQMTCEDTVEEAMFSHFSIRDVADPNPPEAETSRGYLLCETVPGQTNMAGTASIHLAEQVTHRYNDVNTEIVGRLVEDSLERLLFAMAELTFKRHNMSMESQLGELSICDSTDAESMPPSYDAIEAESITPAWCPYGSDFHPDVPRWNEPWEEEQVESEPGWGYI